MMEEQTIGTKLTQLQATDIDSNIEAYHLSTNDYLEINNITGKLSSSIDDGIRINAEALKMVDGILCIERERERVNANEIETRNKHIYHYENGE